ncbi:MAG TPA: HEAT repeat domain-containing protein [Vicinamibacterales bacterium]
MDKLVERETATRNPLAAAPALAVQFFLIPLTVVAITAGVYMGFRSMLADTRGPRDYLVEIRTGGETRAWPAALELAKSMDDPKARADKALAVDLIKAFDESKTGDPRVRKYLALAIGRLEPPLPSEAVAILLNSLNDPERPWTPDPMSRFNGWTPEMAEAHISTIWALGASGDASVAPKLQPLYASEDAGVRKMVVYALGALPGETQIVTLRTALQDSVADVRWNAAVALARHGNHEGAGVVQQMLDRPYVEQAVKRDVRVDEDQDPIADVMISGLRAAAMLKDDSLKTTVRSLSEHDKSLKVREAALEALKMMG